MQIIKKLNHYFLTHQSQNLHSVKYTLAFSLGFLATLIMPDHYSVWILITIAVVMSNQPIVGQLVQKSLFRILGTLIGVSFGVMTYYLPQTTAAIFFAVICVSFLITRLFVFRSDQTSQVAILGLVTFSLVTFLGHQSIMFACMRFIDTVIGILISFFVSRFIFPMTSKRAFNETLQKTTLNLSVFVTKVFIDCCDRRTHPEVNQIEAVLVQGLTKMRAALRSGRFESIRSPVEKEALNNLIRYLRSIYHYLIFIDVALSEIADSDDMLAKEARKNLQPLMYQLIGEFEGFSSGKEYGMPPIDTLDLDKVKRMNRYDSQYYAISFACRRIPYCLKKMHDASVE